MPQPLPYFVVSRKTVFTPLLVLYPECMVLIADSPQLYPLQCLRTTCPKNASCMEILAKRVNYWFTRVEPAAEMFIAYFRYKDRPDSIRAGVFHRDLREPRTITLNVSALAKFKKEGHEKYFVPTQEYNNIHGIQQLPNIIPASSLIR